MIAPVDISAEAVADHLRRLSINRMHLNGRLDGDHVSAAYRFSEQSSDLIRALRAALDAAERERDEARKERSHQQGRADANARKTAEEQRRADAADATGYARGVRDAAGLAQRLKAQPCISGKCTCWPTCEARKTDASLAEIAAAILALLPATDAPKETRDDQ